MDRKNVIAALEYMISEGCCTDTQFDFIEEIEKAIELLKAQERDMADMREDLQDTLKENMRMAELLEAQEPVKPVWLGGENEHIGFYACGSCGMNMGTNPNYCWYCGRKVKW